MYSVFQFFSSEYLFISNKDCNFSADMKQKKDDSTSRRTASLVVTDWQSEAVRLIVIINLTKRVYLMRLMRVLDEARII